MKKQLLLLSLMTLPAISIAEEVDFEKIVYWSGSGENKAALVVQFSGEEARQHGAIIWGYRWDGESTTDEMMRKIAVESEDFLFLQQYTGSMGYTLDGVGYGPSVSAMLHNLYFDYDAAVEDGKISFGYIVPNTGMGQTEAPGQETLNLVEMAIADAEETHVIDHPLNPKAFGYPAYDYDHWKMRPTDGSIWQAGWYEGYWSFWTGKEDTENLMYSGMGMSSVKLSDGYVSAWRYTILDGSSDFGADDAPWLKINYSHEILETPDEPDVIIDDITTEGKDTHRVYALDGTLVYEGGDGYVLPAGIYIVKSKGTSKKILIKQPNY